jgi:hypothetical protein
MPRTRPRRLFDIPKVFVKPTASTAPSAPATTSPVESLEPVPAPAVPAAEPAEEDDADDDADDDDAPDAPETPAPADAPPAETPTEPAAPEAAHTLGAFERGRMMLRSKKGLIADIERLHGDNAALRARVAALEPAAAASQAASDRAKAADAALAAAQADAKTVSTGVRDELAALGVTTAAAPPVNAAGDPAAMTKEEARRQFAELDAKDPSAARAFYLANKDLIL